MWFTTISLQPRKLAWPGQNYKEKKFVWNHGITLPLKNVRKRRFRKTAKKKYIESPDVEKEVKRLLSTDAEAVSTRWEIIAEDETKETENQGLDISSPGMSGQA